MPTYATDPSTPNNPTDSQHPPAGETPDRPSRNPLVVVLLVVIALLLAVIAGLLATRPSGVGGQAAATAPAAAGEQTPAPQPQTGETLAPSITEPNTLAIMRAEVKRDPNDGQAMGKVDAPVVLVVYSDFACPYCTLFAQEVQPALKDLVDDGTLRVEWRDLAQITPTSPLAAQAGLAAAAQGRFWEFHDAVYAAADPQGHPTYSEESLVAFASQAGVPDLEAFKTTMNSEQTKQAVEQAKQHAYQLGIAGTPFMIVNDAVISGYRDGDYVRATVLDQAAQAGK